jgi:hypothetical protein
MNFTVEWTDPTQQDLAALWVAGPDRNAITAAANAIDAALARDPLAQGESRRGSTRVMFHAPLGVYYNVNQTTRTVTVWAVWRTTRRP